MLREVISHLSRLQTSTDHLLDSVGVQSVEDVTDPLLVNVDPVAWIWQVSEQGLLRFRKFEEIGHCESLDLGDSRNLDSISLDVLKFKV